ncbi:MAG TPA: hypothetical protein VF116_06985 [Ktedonobacterales bacterium]
MVNAQRPGGLARWENTLLWAFLTVILASAPISVIAIIAEDATGSGVRNLAQLVLIADALAIAIVASLTFWMIFRRRPARDESLARLRRDDGLCLPARGHLRIDCRIVDWPSVAYT